MNWLKSFSAEIKSSFLLQALNCKKNFMIGISTSYFAARGFSIYESVRRASDLGFSLIELGANHNYEDKIRETLIKIRQDFPQALFTQHCYFPPPFKTPVLSNAGEGLTSQNKKIIATIFEAARILKPALVSFHCGTNWNYHYQGELKKVKGFKGFLPRKEMALSLAKRNAKDFWTEVIQKGEESGIKLAVENMWCISGETPLLTTVQDFQIFFQDFPKLSFLLDYAHAILHHANLEGFFSQGEKIVEIHLSGIKDGRDHWSIMEGLDLERLSGQIKRLKVQPLLVFEHSAEVKEGEVLKEKRLMEKYLISC